MQISFEKKSYPATITLDDPETGEGVKVGLRVAMLTQDQSAAFESGMKRLNEPPSLRLLGGRAPTGEEQAKDERGRYVVSDADVIERRVGELAPEARAAYDQADAADNAFVEAFARQAIADYITVDPDQVADRDGQEVRTGEALYRLFFARKDVLRELLVLILHENAMSAHQKKVWRSLSDFKRFSNESTLAQVGPKLADLVNGAASSGTAETGAVTASTAAPSGSGVTDSSSTSARSHSSRKKLGRSSPSFTGVTT